ncbi:MAG: DUF1800 family protein [Planctomycetes bacterium]|nr:DUF1800 family protein [Planctomycetota bacterium]
MQRLSSRGCTLALGLVFIQSAFSSAQTPSAQTPLHERIDKQIESGAANFDRTAAAAANDAEFLRRLFLDVKGVIPSATEARAFLEDKSLDKRQKVIDRLLASDAYAWHMRDVFDVLLMDRRPEKNVKAAEWREFLQSSFTANKSYDRLVAEILSADGVEPKSRPAARFLLDRNAEPHQLTRDISRLFLGMNLHCCQCHDHPLVDAYKQEFYYGIYAFLSRSFVFTDKANKQAVLVEKGDGDVTFQSVFMKQVTKNTGPRLPSGPVLTEPKLDKGQEYVVPYKPGEKPQPKFSRRSHLAGQITGPENPRFARAAANRLWSIYFGRGIVDPVEYDHPANPPSHPELLNQLAEDFAARKYDMKAFIREILLSRTYQRSSEAPSADSESDPRTFAVAALRPLSPEQLAWSMMQATGLLDAERKAQGAKVNEAATRTKLAGNVQTFVNLFGSQPGTPTDPSQFEATLDQTLFVSNGNLLRDWLAQRPGSLTHRLAEIKESGSLAEELYLSVLSRLPSADESKEVADFLARRSSDRSVALQDLAWALLSSAEFRFNH